MLPPDQQLQDDIAARLGSDDVLVPIAVVKEADGATDSDIAQALGPMRAGGKPGGQAGSLVLVMGTEDGGDVQPNVPGPREQLRITVRVLELPKLRGAVPGSLGYAVIAARIKALLHQCQIGTAPVLYVGGSPFNDGAGTIGKDLRFSWTPAPQIIRACAAPLITLADDAAHMTTTTPGASIAWTRDGSYPTPGNCGPDVGFADCAALFGDVVRAVTYAPGMIPSGVSEKAVTPQP